MACSTSASSERLSMGIFSGGGAASPRDNFSSSIREKAAPRWLHAVVHVLHLKNFMEHAKQNVEIPISITLISKFQENKY